MKSNADAILESLIGDVQTNYGGPIDVSSIVAKSDTKPRELPPPLLLTETDKEKRKREKHEKLERRKRKLEEKEKIEKKERERREKEKEERREKEKKYESLQIRKDDIEEILKKEKKERDKLDKEKNDKDGKDKDKKDKDKDKKDKKNKKDKHGKDKKDKHKKDKKDKNKHSKEKSEKEKFSFTITYMKEKKEKGEFKEKEGRDEDKIKKEKEKKRRDDEEKRRREAEEKEKRERDEKERKRKEEEDRERKRRESEERHRRENERRRRENEERDRRDRYERERSVRSSRRDDDYDRYNHYDRHREDHYYDRSRRKRRRKVSPVQIFEEDYTDKYGRLDRKKLLDIATRNVTKLAMSGALPKGYELLTTMKKKSVNELIELCRKLHDEDERARADRPSSSSEDESGYVGGRYWEENRGSFGLKEPQEVPKPRYEMVDGIPRQIMTADERRADDQMLRVTYPVSSGYEHRLKEQEPAEDDLPDLPLLNALARIKTNIPPPFTDSFESQILSLCDKPQQLALPAPEPKTEEELRQINVVKQQETLQIATLPKPIEISKPVEGLISPSTSSSVGDTQPATADVKPVRIRASFLKSGKKAAEEVLQKLMTNDPKPVPAPESDIKTEGGEPKSQDIAKLLNIVASVPENSSNIVLPVEKESPIDQKGDVNHADALSALLDKVDRLITTGNIEQMAVIEKKFEENQLFPSPVKSGDYVKVPGLDKIIKREMEEAERQIKKEVEEQSKTEEIPEEKVNLFKLYLEAREYKQKEEEVVILPTNNDDGLVDISDDEKTAKKKKKDKEKKHKKKKREIEEGEIVEEEVIKKKKKKRKEYDEDGNEIPRKKKKHSSPQLAIEAGTSSDFIGPQKPPEFNHRDPTPFIKAITAPQLAIENTKSLKAEWNDPKNPLTLPPIFINNDDSMPMPFRIVPPAREPVIKPEDMVFKAPKCITHPPKMINELLIKRSRYAKDLAENPNDYYAKKTIAHIDREMSAWAESKNIPGKFTGRTGARVLSADELGPSDPRYNAWARKVGPSIRINPTHAAKTYHFVLKFASIDEETIPNQLILDLFANAPEHESEFGRKIMEKYGWQKGAGLGRQMSGPVEPLKLDIKSDRRGLQAATDRKPGRNAMIADIDGKNPISLVMEYCAKKRLQPPTFTCIESGPANARRFLWKCTVDNVEYEPSMASANKKAGKTEVCYVVLQALGQIAPVIPE